MRDVSLAPAARSARAAGRGSERESFRCDVGGSSSLASLLPEPAPPERRAGDGVGSVTEGAGTGRGAKGVRWARRPVASVLDRPAWREAVLGSRRAAGPRPGAGLSHWWPGRMAF